MPTIPIKPSAPLRDMKVDVLRGMLALSVVVTHATMAWSEPPAPLAYYNDFLVHSTLVHPGVVGFIVLSGFCIHWATINGGSFSTRKYSIRRAFRILPVLWFSVLLGIISVIVVGGIGENSIDLSDVIARVLLLAPLLPIDAPLGNSPLDTVVIEAWLYVVYPLFYFGLFRKWPIMFVAILAACALVPPLLTVAQVNRVWAFTNLFGFLPLWWIGMIAADVKAGQKGMLTETMGRMLSRIRPAYLIAALALVLTLINLTDRYGALGAACRYAFQFMLAFSLAKLLTSDFGNSGPLSPFASLGLASYSLYAVHFPILTMVLAFSPNGFQGFALGLAAVALVTLVVYRTVEAPSHQLARKLSSRGRKAGGR